MTAAIQNNGGSQFDILVGGIVVATIDATGIATGLATGSVLVAALVTEAKPLGAGQTLQSLVGSRALGVTYTNTTGRTIWVSAFITTGASSSIPIATIDGVAVAKGGFGSNTVFSDMGINFPVNSGSTYSITANSGSLTQWFELRA
jgi:hypothetical protein